MGWKVGGGRREVVGYMQYVVLVGKGLGAMEGVSSSSFNLPRLRDHPPFPPSRARP